MENLELYTKVAERYDKEQIVGAPLTNTLLKILMNLLNPSDAAPVKSVVRWKP